MFMASTSNPELAPQLIAASSSRTEMFNNCPSFLNTANTKPLSLNQTDVLVRLTLVGSVLNAPITDDKFADDLRKLSSLRLFVSRLPKETADKISFQLALFLDVLSEGVPGNIVLWAWTVHSFLHREIARDPSFSKVLNLDDFTFSVFPHGVPTESETSRIWDAQKLDGSNLLDNPNTWVIKHDSDTPS